LVGRRQTATSRRESPPVYLRARDECRPLYEYFHGDNGAGVGASHQTGWTGVVSGLIHAFGAWTVQDFLEGTAVGGRLGPERGAPAGSR
jgi:hypothetical protein